MTSREKIAFRLKETRREQIDASVPMCGGAKSDRIDLGLALLSLAVKPGQEMTRDDIALWCGCTNAAIYLLEVRAMKKLRNRLMFGKASATGRELVA